VTEGHVNLCAPTLGGTPQSRGGDGDRSCTGTSPGYFLGLCCARGGIPSWEDESAEGTGAPALKRAAGRTRDAHHPGSSSSTPSPALRHSWTGVANLGLRETRLALPQENDNLSSRLFCQRPSSQWDCRICSNLVREICKRLPSRVQVCRASWPCHAEEELHAVAPLKCAEIAMPSRLLQCDRVARGFK
jgi:hypothetical protein